MTEKSNSPAVEAVLHRDQDGTYFLKYERDEQIYDVAMRNSPLAKAMDAYVTSQQEVVTPVGPLRKLHRAIECLEILNRRPRPMCRDCADSKFEGICDNGGLDCDMDALITDSKASLKAIAASRVPVASGAEPECENCNQLVRALREATEGPMLMGEPVLPMHRNWHHKSNPFDLYTVLAVGKLQTAEPVGDMTNVVIYQGPTGIWVRPKDEFLDGRFHEASANPTPEQGRAAS